MAASAMMTVMTMAAPPRCLLGGAARSASTSTISAANPSPQFLGGIAHSRKPRVYASSVGQGESVVESAPSVHSVKEFLEDLKSVGRVRIIVNTGVGVLESVVTTLDKLFYSELPGKGEYANLMSKEDNVDFHLLIAKVASAKLVQGKSMRGDVPTYMVRFFDALGGNAASLLVMWRPERMGNTTRDKWRPSRSFSTDMVLRSRLQLQSDHADVLKAEV